MAGTPDCVMLDVPGIVPDVKASVKDSSIGHRPCRFVEYSMLKLSLITGRGGLSAVEINQDLA